MTWRFLLPPWPFVLKCFLRYLRDHCSSLLSLCISYSGASLLTDAFVKGQILLPLFKIKTAVYPVAPSFSLAVSEHCAASSLSPFAQYLFLSTLDVELPFSAWEECVFKMSSFLRSCWKNTETGKSCVYLHAQIGFKLWPSSLRFYSAVILNSNNCIPVWPPLKWTAVLECFLDHSMQECMVSCGWNMLSMLLLS